MSTSAHFKTNEDPNLVIPQSEYNELKKYKSLFSALGIENVEELSVGQLIKMRRALTPLTVEQLAESTGIDRGGLSKIEEGLVKIQLRTLNKFESVFGKAFTSYIINLIQSK